MVRDDRPDFFQSMQSVSRTVARQMGWEKEEALWGLVKLWEKTFGDPVARVSYPLSQGPDGLVVACDSALWMRELTFLLPELRARLAEVRPDLSGRPISFRVIRPFRPPGRRATPPQAGPSRAEVALLWTRAEEIAAGLPPALRERGKTFVFLQMINGSARRRTPPA